MKTVLCFGDSNTWGAMPFRGDGVLPRHVYDDRWTTLLEQGLIDKMGVPVRVVVDAICGRTIAYDSPISGTFRNGLKHAPNAVLGHYPVDCIVVMLGTNDVMDMYHTTPQSITADMLKMIECMRHYHGKANPCHEPSLGDVPMVLVAPPPVVNPKNGSLHAPCAVQAKSEQLSYHYEQLAKFKDIGFFDAGTVVSVSPDDGIHWDTNAHHIFGRVLADYVNAYMMGQGGFSVPQ